MKRLSLTAVALLALGFCIVRGPQVAHAVAYTYDIVLGIGPDGTLRREQTTDAGILRTAPATTAPQVPVTCALTQAGNGCCDRLAAGQQVELTCDGTNDCYYRVVASYGAADGGFPTVYPDGGGGYAVAGADTYLKARTSPGRIFYLPHNMDSICAVSADGGTLNASPLYQ